MFKRIWNAIKEFFSSQSIEDKVEFVISGAEAASKFTATDLDDKAAKKLRASKSAIIEVLKGS